MATYDKTYHVKTQIRSDILANWLSANPVLLNGELAIVRFYDDEDTTALKVGNGWQNFSDLPYLYAHSLSLSDIVVDEATSAVTVFGRPLAFESSVPEVHDAALTIQRNGVDLTSFTANSDTPVSANIVVPTSTEDLTNNSGFATSSYVDGKFAVLSSIPTKVQELSSSLSSMSADIVEGLSNQVAPKLSTIADLVAAETQRVDALSNDLSSYVKTIDNAVLSDTVSAVYEEVISAGTIISTEINPKLDLVSTLVSAEVESVNALRQGLSAYVTKTENASLSTLANTIQSDVSAMSAEVIDGLSNQIAPKLSAIADLVTTETQRVDDLSNDLSSYVKTTDIVEVSLSSVEKDFAIVLTEEQKAALIQESGMPAEVWGDFAISIDASNGMGYIGNIDCFSAIQNENGDWVFAGGMPALNVLGWVANSTVIQGSKTSTQLVVGSTSVDLALESDIEKMLPLNGGGQITGGFGVVDTDGNNLFNVNNYGEVLIGNGTVDRSNTGIAIGYQTSANSQNIAIGYEADASGNGSIALGDLAKATNHDAVQIGTGTNNSQNTLQFRNYPLVDSNGNIPYERLSANLSVSLSNYVSLSGGIVSPGFYLSSSGGDYFLTNQGRTLGPGAEATGSGAIAYGSYSQADGHESVAVGSYSKIIGATAIDAVAIGCGAVVSANSLMLDAVQIGLGTNVIPYSLNVYDTKVLSSKSGNSPNDFEVCDNVVSSAITRQAGEIRNVLPISAMPANSVNLTKNTYVYRVTDTNGTGAFPTIVAPTDVTQTGTYYFTFEIEWTTAAELASYSQTFDWINMPEMVQGSESHTYYITGRYDSGLSSYTMNCWRTK